MTDKPIADEGMRLPEVPTLTEATEKLVREHYEQHGGSLTESLSTLVAAGKHAIDNPRRGRPPLVKPGVVNAQE